MKNICIIGGGPIGLNAYIKLKNKGYNCKIFEANSFLGGQVIKFFAVKDIADLQDYESINAKDYIDLLVKQVSNEDVYLNTEVIDIKKLDNKSFEVITSSNNIYNFDYVVLAIGLGTSSPRELELDNAKNSTNLQYSVDNFEIFKDKKVVILGGGDSALDWANHISKLTDNISLVHRRDEFRGNADTIKDNKIINVKLSFIPFKLNKQGNKITSIIIQSVKDNHLEELPLDYLIVNYGSVPKVNKFFFKNEEGNFINTTNYYKTNIEGVFAIGDISNYGNKKRRIQPGLDELEYLLKDF